ncbi:hypothetical protein L2E82_16745 [Cichorium intybus]|uniref:Uncharacterized protein n=1 Tax=Cichorium intybus TaxID=13427 RepID=A0ACB9F7M9_CICIN|nr:hypothetical protein L2E82_16745 [Cichorium intybus]
MEVYRLLGLLSSIVFLSCSDAVDRVYTNQPIKDGNTIISDGETYELGFFSPGKSKNRYLGIWKGQSSFKRKKAELTVVLSVSSSALLLSVVAYVFRKKKKMPLKKGRGYLVDSFDDHTGVKMENLDELPFISLHQITKATDNFNINKKIGEGGFGSVYKGVLDDEQVVGTYGYISPEYAVHGRFSIKSDVFSFGVLVLEIVSGKKNRGFSHEGHRDNLLGHAWRLFKEDN